MSLHLFISLLLLVVLVPRYQTSFSSYERIFEISTEDTAHDKIYDRFLIGEYNNLTIAICMARCMKVRNISFDNYLNNQKWLTN